MFQAFWRVVYDRQEWFFSRRLRDDCARPRELFDSPEHEHTGNRVQLWSVTRTGGDMEEEEWIQTSQLRLQNGINISFGMVIAMGGDFYGVPDCPITPQSDPRSNDPQSQKRFRAAYGTLACEPKEGIEKEIDAIKRLLEQERESLQNQCVHSVNFNKKYDEITGGRWVGGIPVVYGRMMKLALTNHDHFQPHAKFAYLAGHELALECAKQAGLSDDGEERKKGLEEAYAIDGFACHFLTDSFASGHMRYEHYCLPIFI